jgi:DNA modification methylase
MKRSTGLSSRMGRNSAALSSVRPADAEPPVPSAGKASRTRRRGVPSVDTRPPSAAAGTGVDTGASSEHDAREAPAISLEWIATADLIHSKRRLAKANDRQHRQLMSSISTFGFLAPLVISADNEVVVGEKRLAAAAELGLARLPVVRASKLTPSQIRQYRIADNRLNELREWDPDALKEELGEIVILDPDISIEAMGFEIAEFDVALHSVDGGPDPADIVSAPPETALSCLGDVWEVDDHLIACGDARDAACLANLLGDLKAAVVFADSPFNVRVNGHVGGKGAIKHPEFVMGSGEMSAEAFQAFQTAWIAQAAAVTAAGGLLYFASDWRVLQTVFVAGQTAGLELLNLAVWQKQAGMGSFYRSAHELFPVWRKTGADHRNNILLGANGRHRSNCWSYPGAAGFGPTRDALRWHPTPKPIALVMDILLDCTKRGDVVLDPFSGSGTTLIAAQRTGRRARVLDLDPRYVDVALRRYEEIFGHAARLRGSGFTLADLAGGAVRPAAYPPSGEGGEAQWEPLPVRRRVRTRGATKP